MVNSLYNANIICYISMPIDIYQISSFFNFSFITFPAGTHENTMYKLMHAQHALNNDTTVADDIYVGECQDSSKFNRGLIQGNLLICSYSIRFELGLSSINQALETAMNLSAVGVVFPMDPFMTGFQLDPIPMKMPSIIIPSANDSKVHYPFPPSILCMTK